MHVKLESSVERASSIWFKSIGVACWKLAPLSVIGIPDRIVLGVDRLIFFIEYKRPGCTPTKIQLYMHNKIKRFGFRVYVCTTIEETKAAYETEVNRHYSR